MSDGILELGTLSALVSAEIRQAKDKLLETDYPVLVRCWAAHAGFLPS